MRPLAVLAALIALAASSCNNTPLETTRETSDAQRKPTPEATCNDGNPCTRDYYSTGAKRCIFAPQNSGYPCPDNDLCNGDETCDGGGQCRPGTPLQPEDIYDDNPCTIDACDPQLGVTHTPGPSGSSCDNGSLCDGLETCNAQGICIAGIPPDLDDADLCTLDTCDPQLGVRHLPLSADDNDPTTLDTCDPATGAISHISCPELDATVAARLAEIASCIYQGPSPLQKGLTKELDPATISVVRGKAETKSGEPASGVRVSVLEHPDLGYTLTRQDGLFELVVPSGQINLRYEKNGYLTVERQTDAAPQHFGHAPDVVMIPLDAQVTPVELGSTETQIARGSTQSDADGQRQATLLIPPDTHASKTIKDQNGALIEEPLVGPVQVRATEYTVGNNGPRAMPGTLPSASAYTYAVELGLDEALDAVDVHFDKPLPVYVDNFLGFPVGQSVPVGYYDKERGVWVASENGRVIAIVGKDGSGAALIDLNGDGVADTGQALTDLGINDDERQKLASLYAPGASLWRARITHFTPWDLNWPYGPPPDACTPDDAICSLGSGPVSADPLDDPCTERGSIIECENQILGERVPIAGTPFSLHYQSDRVPGRKDAFSLAIPITGANIPSSLKSIELEVSVAGRIAREHIACPCTESEWRSFDWDGKDVFGRTLVGRQPVEIKIGYTYDAVYMQAADLPQAFGAFSNVPMSGSQSRNELTLWRRYAKQLGTWDGKASGLGGWTLSTHHAYDPNAKALYRGDGMRRSGDHLTTMIRTLASDASLYPEGLSAAADGSIYFADGAKHRIAKLGSDGTMATIAGTGLAGYNGDDIPAKTATLNSPRDVAIAPDGTVYFSDMGNHRVRRVGPDGVISTIASMNVPQGLALTPEGSLYVVNEHRIERIGPDGMISTVAGNGSAGFGGEDIPATSSPLSYPEDVTVGPDSSLYIAEKGNHRIRRVDPNGIIRTIAGTGISGYTGDGGPATTARLANPTDVAVGADGSVFVVAWTGGGNPRSVIRRISPDGIITTVAGRASDPDCGLTQFCGDGGPATAAHLPNMRAVAVDGKGDLLLSEVSPNPRIARVSAPVPGIVNADFAVANDEGSELYLFDKQGRHLETRDTRLGIPLYQFGYDVLGRLSTITDRDGITTTITRDANGDPTSIITPFGQTVLSVDAEGYLASVSNPANETVSMTYFPGTGLLKTFVDEKTQTHAFEYDPATGRLTKDTDPAGGYKKLTRVDTSSGYSVTIETAEGRTRTHEVAGALRTHVAANGTQAAVTSDATGTRSATLPDGTTITQRVGGDPRFGMQSPIVIEETVSTPGGKVRKVKRSRSVTLDDPTNPLSLSGLVETLSINDRTTTQSFFRATKSTTTTTPLGRMSTTTVDAKGHLVAEQLGGLLGTSYGLDALGRRESATTGARSWSWGYDASGMLVTETNPLLETTSYLHDAVGRVLEETRADGEVLATGYDERGNATSVTPPGRPAHVFGFTPVDLMESHTAPPVGGASSTTTWSYDLDRLLLQQTRPDQSVIVYERDAAGRLDFVTLPGTQGIVDYTFAPATGHLESVAGPMGVTVAYSRDGFLLTGKTWSGAANGSVSWEHDDDFRVAVERVNGAYEFDFGYDDDGLLTQAGGLTLTRDPQNGLVTGSTLGTVSDTRSYNGHGELLGYGVEVGGAAVYATSCTRDALGRISSLSETIQGEAHTYDYAYDLAGRLIEVKRDGVVTAEYGLDANGNRLMRTTDAGSESASYDAQDRLIAYGTKSYTYSLNGDLESVTDATTGKTTTYSYDALGNLRHVGLPSGDAIAYIVDGERHRVWKTKNGAKTKGWLWSDDLRSAAELDATGNVVARFVYATPRNVPEVIVKNGAAYRVVMDHLGSVRLVVDAATGVVVQRIDYDEFGRVLVDTNPGFQPFGFAGGLYDSETGLVRFGVRDYDAQTGRWTSKDPLLFGGGDANLYGYVLGDPINFVDPEGKWADAIPWGAVGEVGLGIGALLSVPIWGVPAGILGVCIAAPLLLGSDAGTETDERERCRRVRDMCVSKCMPQIKKRLDRPRFDKCMRDCLEENGCWKINY